VVHDVCVCAIWFLMTCFQSLIQKHNNKNREYEYIKQLSSYTIDMWSVDTITLVLLLNTFLYVCAGLPREWFNTFPNSLVSIVFLKPLKGSK
jgi:hypothetical protein